MSKSFIVTGVLVIYSAHLCSKTIEPDVIEHIKQTSVTPWFPTTILHIIRHFAAPASAQNEAKPTMPHALTMQVAKRFVICRCSA